MSLINSQIYIYFCVILFCFNVKHSSSNCRSGKFSEYSFLF